MPHAHPSPYPIQPPRRGAAAGAADGPQQREGPELSARPADRQGRLRRDLPRHASARCAVSRPGLRQDQLLHRGLGARGLFRPAARPAGAGAPGVRPVRRAGGRPGCATAWSWSTPSMATWARGWRRRAHRRSASCGRRSPPSWQTLDVLHRGQAMHRDLTPFNVFVCENERLKLGDFGIAAHQANSRGVTADAFNPLNAPDRDRLGQGPQVAAEGRRLPGRPADRDAASGRHPQPDAEQGCPRASLQRPPEGGHPSLPRRTRAKRYQAAGELIAALRHRPKELKHGPGDEPRGPTAVVHRIPEAAPQRGDQGGAARRRRGAVESGRHRPTCWCGAGPTSSRWRARPAAPSCWRSSAWRPGGTG